MKGSEAFELSKSKGTKIAHDSFDDGEYIYFNLEEGVWFDNEGDDILPQQFTGEFFEEGWEIHKK